MLKCSRCQRVEEIIRTACVEFELSCWDVATDRGFDIKAKLCYRCAEVVCNLVERIRLGPFAKEGGTIRRRAPVKKSLEDPRQQRMFGQCD